MSHERTGLIILIRARYKRVFHKYINSGRCVGWPKNEKENERNLSMNIHTHVDDTIEKLKHTLIT